MKKYTYLIIILLFFSACGNDTQSQNQADFKGESIKFQAKDGVTIKADVYKIKDDNAPYILLFHQASYSRGEYREIAPKLNKLGFNCIAIDQRSGKEVNGVINETFHNAKKANKGTKYPDAFIDLETTLEYAKNELKAKKVIVWGSSYSSSLVFCLGAKYKDKVQGVLSFSPGEYFTLESKTIESYAVQVTCPVFITSAKNEQGQWQDIYDNIKSQKAFYLPETKGFHGSKALWSSNKGHQNYWKAVEKFLRQFQK